MRLEQQRQIQVALETPEGCAHAEQLEAFLARPLRPLRGLLDPARLQAIGDDRYVYCSRPYRLAGWTLQPQVTLLARWDGQHLVIRQLDARVEGLGEWQDLLQFGLMATIGSVVRQRPCPTSADAGGPALLEAKAQVWAHVPARAAALVAPVLRLALQQLLDRLERRCQRGLRRRAQAWLNRSSKLT